MRTRLDMLIAAGLALAIVICYARVGGFEFVNYDDHRYITQNPRVQQGLTFDNIAWAFTTFEVANWHPLTWISHMADVDLFGTDSAAGHHLVNVLLHIANTILLLHLLRRMTGPLGVWRSALVAALFALHPLRVESVAWISERKDVLSVFFGLLTMHAYLNHAAKRSFKTQVIMMILFACSLMSKSMLVTLPALLLVLDYWPLKRFETSNLISQVPRLRGLVNEKLPLMALSAASAVLTLLAQRSGGAISDLDAVPLGSRLMNAAAAYATYIRQMFVPLNLAPLYPLPKQWPVEVVVGSLALLAAVTLIVAVLRRKRPELFVGWLWYLGTLVPVIGLVQVGSQAHADRYTYFPMIGLLIMIVWIVPAPRSRPIAALGAGVTAIALATLMWLTIDQAPHWRNSIALSEHTLRVTTNNGYAHFNLGNACMDEGRFDEAIEQFQLAGEVMPNWPDAPFNMGNALSTAGRHHEAITAFDEALRRNPRFIGALNNRGIALSKLGELDRAIDSFQAALQIDADNATAHYNLGQTYMRLSQLGQAMVHLQRAVAIQPNHAMAHLMLGNVLAMQNRIDEAMAEFARSLDLDSENPHAHMSMAAALAERGRLNESLAHLNVAAQLAQAGGDQDLLAEIRRRMDRHRAAPR